MTLVQIGIPRFGGHISIIFKSCWHRFSSIFKSGLYELSKEDISRSKFWSRSMRSGGLRSRLPDSKSSTTNGKNSNGEIESEAITRGRAESKDEQKKTFFLIF